MIVRVIQAERMKLRRSPVWLAFFVLPILPAVMGTFNYSQNIAILENGWYSLWSQHTLFTCYFFLPALIGVYGSYLFRLEHTNHNWNQMGVAPIPRAMVYFAKLWLVSEMILFTQIWIGILFVVSGKLVGLAGPIPPELFVWLLSGWVGAISIAAVQLAASMLIRSFAVPVGIALIGGITGLAAASKGFGLWYPYSLLSLGMNANSPLADTPISGWSILIHSLMIVAIVGFLAYHWLNQRDVTTG